MEDKDTKDMPPVHLILGASDYFKINTETTPRMGALGEPIGEKAKFVGLLCFQEKKWSCSRCSSCRPRVQITNGCAGQTCWDQQMSSVVNQENVFAECKEQLCRDSIGWWETGLPWRANHPPLEKNESGSLGR